MTQFVHGEGPEPCDLMLVGERPGKDEDKYGRPFVGKSGRELNRYLWRATGRTRTSVFVTNLVRDYLPGDPDPTPEEIKRDEHFLAREIMAVHPEVIVAVGRWSARYFLGAVDMEWCHGIPHWHDALGCVVVPVVHPAAGLHSTEFQGTIAWDFEQLGKLLRGEDVKWATDDEHPVPEYWLGDGWGMNSSTVAVDTEGSTARPWCLSCASHSGTAVCNRDGGGSFRHIVLHNAMHDIGVLRSMNCSYDRFDDTMIMAYLLCVEPQGLKALAKRHCGMNMSSYEELVAAPNRKRALEYMKRVQEWLSRQSNSGSSASPATTSRARKRTSARGGRKSSRTASRARSSRR